MRDLAQQEVEDLSAFLGSLTDPCMMQPACLARWVPDPADDPDGNMLVADEPFAVSYEAADTSASPTGFSLGFLPLAPLDTFPDSESCSTTNTAAANTGELVFLAREDDLGLTASHGFDLATWLGDTADSVLYMDATMMSGGLAASYLDDDCWVDILFSEGSAGTTRLFSNLGGQSGFDGQATLVPDPGGRVSGFAIADINGDYRREAVLSNLHAGQFRVYSTDQNGGLYQAGSVRMGRNSQGVSFGDVDGDGYADMFVAHWSMIGLPGTAPALWKNTAGTGFAAIDSSAGTSSANLPQQFNFSPAFADLDLDGDQDLLVASDFLTSSVLENDGSGLFSNVTNRFVINDRNGMGSAVADFDNDGLLDWFVTSIHIPLSLSSGNRLYRNTSGTHGITFSNVSYSAGIVDGDWGWGACAADFNNDGWLDIFHSNGYTNYPDALNSILPWEWLAGYSVWLHEGSTPSRLFVNNGDGTFTEQASAWGLGDPVDGRGVICLDYDRDGDIDVGLIEHSRGLRFYENQSGSQPGRHFFNIRLVGAAPNTEALGGRVVLEADTGSGLVSQTRVVQAASNFNSQNPPDLHFGLASASEVVRLTIYWPDGSLLQCEALPANQFMIVDQRWGSCSAP